MKLEVHALENSKEAKAILKGIKEFNSGFADYKNFRELTITYKDSKGRVVAGLNGYTNWGWLFVKLLWVSDQQRGKGLGSKLMARAESEARKRRCRNIWLDTFGFQAPGFYEKLGYRRFGELKNYPKGFSRYFYFKKL